MDLPAARRRGHDFTDVHAIHAALKQVAVDGVAILTRYRGAVFSGKVPMICCAVHAAVGWSVIARWTTRRIGAGAAQGRTGCVR